MAFGDLDGSYVLVGFVAVSVHIDVGDGVLADEVLVAALGVSTRVGDLRLAEAVVRTDGLDGFGRDLHRGGLES